MTRFVDSKLTLREWLPLIGITVSAFIFNASEFMPVGLLTGIGASFGTSEGVTGADHLGVRLGGHAAVASPYDIGFPFGVPAAYAPGHRRVLRRAGAFGPGAQLWSAHGSAFGGRLRPFGVLGHCSSRGGEGGRREARAYGR